MPDDLTRRQLVQRAAALVTLPALAGSATGCARRIATERVLDVPAPVDGILALSPADVPELRQLNGAVILHPPGSQVAQPLYPAVLLVAARLGPPPEYFALQARCTHQQCEVSWVGSDREVECPCHLSRFAADGNVIQPPAVVPLATYPVTVRADGTVEVQLFPGDGTFPAVKNGQITLALADYPALQQDGGIVEGRSAGYPFPIVLVNLAGAVKVLSAVCPHQGCTVYPGGKGFVCPCHGSEFELSGHKTLGPAQSDLETLRTDPAAPAGTLIIPLPAL